MTTLSRPSTYRTPLACVTAVTAVILAGCGSGVSSHSAASETGYPVTVKDCGRNLTVTAEPKRIASLSPAQTEMVIRLGLANRLVGQAQTASQELPADIRSQAADVPVLSSDAPPNREALLKAQPDFVFAPTSFEFSAENGYASVEQVTNAGAAAYIAAGGCTDRRAKGMVDDVFTDIDALGTIFAVHGAADRLADSGRARLAAVERRIAGKSRPRVAQLYIEATSVSAIAGGVEFDVVRRAGGDSVYRPDERAFAQSPWATVTPEDVAARQPEVIVFAVTSPENEREVRQILSTRFAQTPAVRNGQLFAIPAADMSPGALGSITAVEKLSRELHP